MSQPLLFVLMALAAYRLWRFVGVDLVPGAAVRGWLDDRATRSGDTRRADRWLRVLDLVTCRWCLGSWITFAVVGITAQLTRVELPVLQAIAAAAAVGLIGIADPEG